MMTNLLASIVVTLLTNQTEMRPIVGHEPGHGGTPDCPTCLVWVQGAPIYSTTEKRVTQTVQRVTALRFEFEGRREVEISRETVSSNTKIYYLEKTEDWKQTTEPPKTP